MKNISSEFSESNYETLRHIFTKYIMNSTLINHSASKALSPKPKKTKKELKDEVRKEKALIKWAKKAALREKTEKKLAEKAERKVSHKANNAKRKLEKKLWVPSTVPPVAQKFVKKGG